MKPFGNSSCSAAGHTHGKAKSAKPEAAAVFPDRKAPQVAAYSIRKTYGKLLDQFEKALPKRNRFLLCPFTTPWLGTKDRTRVSIPS